ncbi:MAG: rod shape-determining protein RodA [Kiritimatiellae bacterium]|nr:rod shape-determining protein RodA [Kiritimatiellia bacterium]
MTFGWLKRLWRLFLRQDWIAVLTAVALLGIGLAFIYSASWRGEDTGIVGAWFHKQIVWASLGGALALTLALVDYHFWTRHAWLLFLVSVVLLVLVLVAGRKVYGAYRWLVLFGVPVQPSEFAKVALVILVAHVLGNPALPPHSLGLMLVVLLLAAVPFMLILVEPDLGTALVLGPTIFFMLFAAGMRWRYFFSAAVAALAAAPLGWYFILGDYQKERILTFLDPARDPLNSGWNALQAAIAVGSGGIHGKGFLNGTQNVLGFLPRTVSPSDFIFPVIAEETGFVGACILLGLFALLLATYVRAALVAPDPAGSLLATGLAGLLFSHVFVNIGMTIGLLPITGLPLPLVSSGGSFMLSTLAAFGLVQSVFIRRARAPSSDTIG